MRSLISIIIPLCLFLFGCYGYESAYAFTTIPQVGSIWFENENSLKDLETEEIWFKTGNMLMSETGELISISPDGSLMNLETSDMWFHTGSGYMMDAQTGNLITIFP